MFSILLIVATCLSISYAERNLIASPELCATLPNEEFAVDIYRCQNTCGYYGRTWGCLSYKPHGDCYCLPGFARLTEDGDCVSVTEDATCAAQLPITAESCGPNEKYVQSIQQPQSCDRGCKTYGCTDNFYLNGVSTTVTMWGPHCECVDGYQRLNNGQCDAYDSPSCIAERAPSPERCTGIGQIYTENAQACFEHCNWGFDEPWCPTPGPVCICPDNYAVSYYSEFDVRCHPPGQCTTTEAPEAI